MRTRSWQSGLGPLLAAMLLLAHAGSAQSAPGTSPVRSVTGFVANHGQWPDEVLFFARSGGIEATLLRDALVFRPMPDPTRAAGAPWPAPLVLRLPGEGAAAVTGEGLLATAHHFLLGPLHDHVSHVPAYERVLFDEIAPGIDLLVRRDGERFAYDLHVAPGADLAQLELRLEGATAPRVRDDGVLVIDTAAGPVEQRIGASWEVEPSSGARLDVASRFELRPASDGAPRVGFAAPGRDPQRAFVLDPTLHFSTYIGASGQDSFQELDVGPGGAMYLTAKASGGAPITPGAFDTTPELIDAWVGKLSADGSTLEWATVLGGVFTEKPVGVHLDDDGSVVVAGNTWSADFPTTPGCLQSEIAGADGVSDYFVSRLAPDGSALVWSTFFGVPGSEEIDASALMSGGDVLVVGRPLGLSPEPPAPTPGAYDSEWEPGKQVIFRVSADGGELVFLTYFPSGILSMVAGPAGGIYLAGGISPDDGLMGTPGALQEAPTPGSSAADGWAGKLDDAGTELLWATYLGGPGSDGIVSIAVDAAGAVYVAGGTQSVDFPHLSPGAFDTTLDNSGRFVAKLHPEGTGLVWSTLIETATGVHSLWDLVVDAAGNAIVVGSTNGMGLPATPDAIQPELVVSASTGDAHLTKFDAFGESLVYSTYFGGHGKDSPVRVGLTVDQQPRMGFFTSSADLLVTPGAHDTTYNGTGDIGVAAFDLGVAPWTVLGSALAGTSHTPNLAGAGALTPGAPTRLSLRGAEPLALTHFVIGLQTINAPFKGGTFVPAPFRIFNLDADVSGGLDLSFPWLDAPAGIPVYIQVWMQDLGGVLGWSASNALKLVSQ